MKPSVKPTRGKWMRKIRISDVVEMKLQQLTFTNIEEDYN